VLTFVHGASPWSKPRTASSRAHPRYQEPTLGVLVDGELYYIANSQWERFGEDGRIAKSEWLERPVLLRCRFDTPPGRS
jgi:hypothetical protein